MKMNDCSSQVSSKGRPELDEGESLERILLEKEGRFL